MRARGPCAPIRVCQRPRHRGPPPLTPPRRAAQDDGDDDSLSQPATPPTDPNDIANFELCAPIKRLLADKGITSLFDIQARCLPLALEGKDIVGRARTGCGKTYAFVLPIVEILIRDKVRPIPGGPNVICLLPTRELASQVHAEFEHIGAAGALRTLVVYGGTSYAPQEAALRRGVHIVVGTPGRIKDHIERKTMKMQKLRCAHPSAPSPLPRACPQHTPRAPAACARAHATPATSPAWHDRRTCIVRSGIYK